MKNPNSTVLFTRELHFFILYALNFKLIFDKMLAGVELTRERPPIENKVKLYISTEYSSSALTTKT